MNEENSVMGKPYSVIRFNKVTGQLEMPTLLLKTRSGKVLGNINYTNLQLSFVAKGLDNISFDVHKFTNGKECKVWDKLIDLCIIDYKGYGQFEAHVTTNDEDETIKTVVCESLETELGQHILREFHVNDEDAVEHSKDNPFIHTTLCDTNNEKYSLIHRVLKEKAPHWSVSRDCAKKINLSGTVYDANSIWRIFTVDGKSPYDFFDSEVSQEFGIVFTYNTYTREVCFHNLDECVYDKRTNKAIEGYHYIVENDTYYDENDQIIVDRSNLGYCPGIGKDTSIFISKNKLTNAMDMDSDKDSIKNCFYVSGGDDMMTNIVAAANVTGNNYIYLFGNFQYDDMSDELVDKIKKYSKELADKEADFTKIGGVYVYNPNCEYDPKTDTCKDKDTQRILPTAKHIGDKVYTIDTLAYYKDGVCYSRNDCDGTDVLKDAFYEEPGLYTKYCQTADRHNYLEHTKFPDDSYKANITAEDEKNIVIDYFKSNSVIIRNGCESDSFAHVTGNIESMIEVVCDPRYNIKMLKGDSYEQTCTTIDSDHLTGTWSGWVRLERETDSTDAIEFQFTVNVKLTYNTDDDIEYCKQKMLIAIAGMDIKELDFTKLSNDELEDLLKQYNLTSLKSFYESFKSCTAVLKDLYSNVNLEEDDVTLSVSDSYVIATERYNERSAIAEKIYNIRKEQVENISSDETSLLNQIDEFRKELNIEDYFGEELYKEFCSYVREDEYNNQNYISDGLDNSECLEKAKELLDVAKTELSNACMIQYTVSGDLNNIFSLDELEILHESFDLFNYVRASVDDKIYKLRLIEISFSYESPEKLNVTFSQQIESVDGKIDYTQKILEQAAAIAISYDYTTKQAKQGASALNNFNIWKQEGLDSSLYLLKNSKTEEQIFGNTGLWCKSMMDNGMYSKEQLVVTHNGIYMSTDGFDSVKTAFGKFKFNNEWVYGLNTDVIIGDLIVGEKVIISNTNTTVVIDGEGIDITNGSICLSSGNYSIEIDPNHDNKDSLDGYLFCVRNKNNDDIIMSVDTKGNSYYSGKIVASSGEVGGWKIGNGYLLYGDENSNNFIKLNAHSTSGALISKSGSTQVTLTSGYLQFIYDNKQMAKLNSTFWSDTPDIRGVGLNSEPDSKFISFGNKNNINDEKYNTVFLLNYGLDPDNIREDVIIYGTSRFRNKIFLNNGEYIDYSTYAGAYISKGIASEKIYAGNYNYGGDYVLHVNGKSYFSSGLYFNNGYSLQSWDMDGSHFGIGSSGSFVTKNEMVVGNERYDGYMLSVKGSAYINGSTIVSKTMSIGTTELTSLPYADLFCNGRIYAHGAICPDESDEHSCGTASYYWTNVYAKHVETDVSDEREKHEIKEISEKYEQLFHLIQPLTYMFNNGDRVHIGTTSQRLHDAMEQVGLTDMELSAFCKDVKTKPLKQENGEIIEVPDLNEDGNEQYTYGVRYGEFIMLNTHMIQKLYKEIDSLKESISFLIENK